MIEPDIVKQLRIEEKQGLLKRQKTQKDFKSKSNFKKIKDLEFILELQNEVIEEFLSKIKQGKIITNQYVVLTLYELKNYYNSGYWKIFSNKYSIDKYILSFYHLVNTYIEHLEQSSKIKDSGVDEDKNYEKIMKLKNMISILNSV